MQPARIGIDMDEVICDFHGHIFDCAAAHSYLDPGLKYSRPVFEMLSPDQTAHCRALLNDGAVFRDFAPLHDAIEVIQELDQRYDVFIISAATNNPNSLKPKYDWVRTHLHFFDPLKMVLCGHKYFANVDYLIDDSPGHFEQLVGEGILFTAPKNRHETRYKRVDNWSEVAQLFL